MQQHSGELLSIKFVAAEPRAADLLCPLKAHLTNNLDANCRFADEGDQLLYCAEDQLYIAANGFRQTNAYGNQKLRQLVGAKLNPSEIREVFRDWMWQR